MPDDVGSADASDDDSQKARLFAVTTRLRGTLRRAASILEASRALHRVSRHRRHLRQLERLTLRPQ
jgi:hypothetical protein